MLFFLFPNCIIVRKLPKHFGLNHSHYKIHLISGLSGNMNQFNEASWAFLNFILSICIALKICHHNLFPQTKHTICKNFSVLCNKISLRLKSIRNNFEKTIKEFNWILGYEDSIKPIFCIKRRSIPIPTSKDLLKWRIQDLLFGMKKN